MSAETPDDMDAAIDRAFELLVDDDLEGFAIAAKVDGELRAMSFTDLDEHPERAGDLAVCQFPRSELLGKLIADFAVMYGSPDDVADVGAHVATDHLGVDADRADTVRRDLLEVRS